MTGVGMPFWISSSTGIMDQLAALSMHLLGAGPSGYPYMASLERLVTSDCTPHSGRWAPGSRCPTPICIPMLASYLCSHPDQCFARFVLNGLTEGFRIGFDAAATRTTGNSVRNHPSTASSPRQWHSTLLVSVWHIG